MCGRCWTTRLCSDLLLLAINFIKPTIRKATEFVRNGPHPSPNSAKNAPARPAPLAPPFLSVTIITSRLPPNLYHPLYPSLFRYHHHAPHSIAKEAIRWWWWWWPAGRQRTGPLRAIRGGRHDAPQRPRPPGTAARPQTAGHHIFLATITTDQQEAAELIGGASSDDITIPHDCSSSQLE